MREAFFDKSWLLSEDGSLKGLALGYDRCAQHEWGVKELTDQLGVHPPEFPESVQDYRTQPISAEKLSLHVHRHGKRSKAQPWASLVLTPNWFSSECPPDKLANRFGLSFPGRGLKSDPRYDLLTAWSRDGFAILVRGEENVRMLIELDQAFRSGDICVGLPHSFSFLGSGLVFIVENKLSDEEKAEVAQSFADHKATTLAARESGIEERLKAAGKHAYALLPRIDSDGQLLFFLNPRGQQIANSGWFTVAELDEWIEGTGPVMASPGLKRHAHSIFPDARHQILVGLKAQGYGVRRISEPFWLNESEGKVGVVLSLEGGPVEGERLTSGRYCLQELAERFRAKAALTN